MITKIVGNLAMAVIIGVMIAIICVTIYSMHQCGYMTFVYQERTPIAYLIGMCERIN
jgi:hypothetical protein